MIFHSQYSLTIGQYEIMEITGDKNILCKLPFKLPKKWLDKAYTRLMIDYNKQANKDKIGELIEKDSDKLDAYGDISFLNILCKLIKVCAAASDTDNKDLKELYKYKYGKEPITDADFERPFKDIERLTIKANQYYKEVKEDDKIDIELLLINIQLILNIDNIRDHKFYLLGRYIKKAAEINKPKQNERD